MNILQLNIGEILRSVFVYNETAPLIFTRFFFWAFFAVVLLGYSLVYKNKNRTIRAGYLFILSIFFYYKSSGFFFFLVLFSILLDYFIGKWIYQSKNSKTRKMLVAASVIINLTVLAYFKYSYFFIDSLNVLFDADFQVLNHLAVLDRKSVV